MQHDFTFDNQPGASLRGDLNEALQALVGQSSGDAAPAVTYPFMWWMDTTNWLLKQRNAGNTAWMTLAKIVEGQLIPFAGGESADERYARLMGANDFDQVPTVQGTPLAVGGTAIWTSMPISMPFPLYDHIPGVAIPPNDDPNYRYVKLTAGNDGAGQYNYGVLEAETVSSGSPFPTATALVNLPGSPFDGRRINLLNTEGRYVKPGVNSGALANDQMQQITGQFVGVSQYADPSYIGGAFRQAGSLRNTLPGSGRDYAGSRISFSSANSPGSRTGNYTDTRHTQATFFMRLL